MPLDLVCMTIVDGRAWYFRREDFSSVYAARQSVQFEPHSIVWLKNGLTHEVRGTPEEVVKQVES